MQYRSVFRPGAFDGQRIIVTGGGSGIGRCTAHELAALGATVALVGRKPREAQRGRRGNQRGRSRPPTLHRLRHPRGEAGRARPSPAIAQRGRAASTASSTTPAASSMAPLKDISHKGWEAVVRTNLTGGFLMARECYRARWRRTAARSSTSSPTCGTAMPGMGHSGAARAGMLNFTKTAAVEWASSGVRVNAVAPGWIASAASTTYPPRCGPPPAQRCSRARAAEALRHREPKFPRRSCFCCRRRRRSSPAPACASTAPCRTRVPTSTFRTMTAHAPIMVSRSKRRSTSFRPWTSPTLRHRYNP